MCQAQSRSGTTQCSSKLPSVSPLGCRQPGMSSSSHKFVVATASEARGNSDPARCPTSRRALWRTYCLRTQALQAHHSRHRRRRSSNHLPTERRARGLAVQAPLPCCRASCSRACCVVSVITSGTCDASVRLAARMIMLTRIRLFLQHSKSPASS